MQQHAYAEFADCAVFLGKVIEAGYDGIYLLTYPKVGLNPAVNFLKQREFVFIVMLGYHAGYKVDGPAVDSGVCKTFHTAHVVSYKRISHKESLAVESFVVDMAVEARIVACRIRSDAVDYNQNFVARRRWRADNFNIFADNRFRSECEIVNHIVPEVAVTFDFLKSSGCEALDAAQIYFR